jgi:hypothetical protein
MQNAISHPVKRSHLDDASGFSFAGCGTDPHQSPIGIKARADILAIAPGSGRAPEKRRYQADVQGLYQQWGYPGCGHQARFGSWLGRLSDALAVAGWRGPAPNQLTGCRPTRFAGLPSPAKLRRNTSPLQTACRHASCNRPRAPVCAPGLSWPRPPVASPSCAHKIASPAGSSAARPRRPR